MYEMATMTRVAKATWNSTPYVTSVADLVPINASTYGINPVLLIESTRRAHIFNWLGRLDQVGNVVTFSMTGTYIKALSVDYLPYIFIQSYNSIYYGYIYAYRLNQNTGSEQFTFISEATNNLSYGYYYADMDYSYTRGHIYTVERYRYNSSQNQFKRLNPSETTESNEQNMVCNDEYPVTHAFYPSTCTCMYGSVDDDGYYC